MRAARALVAAAAAAAAVSAAAAAANSAAANVTAWHVVWTGGQSNAIGTNSQTSGYPVWPATPAIQMFCWSASHGCAAGSFAPAAVPLYGESNVGFAHTFANLLLQTLPPWHGVVLVNTGVGGTGFHDGSWVVPNGRLLVQSVAAVKALLAALPGALGGNATLHALLWHQGEEDAGDNRDGFHADYCTYLAGDVGALVDFVRAQFPGATNATPFVNGGLLPYWEDHVVGGTGGVVDAIYALNTSRPCTGTADSRVFADFLPDGVTPFGDPDKRSGASGDVIHFTATQAVFLGWSYWSAYLRATALTAPVPSSRTSGCAGTPVLPPVPRCGGSGSA
jgi:hypothetical protein